MQKNVAEFDAIDFESDMPFDKPSKIDPDEVSLEKIDFESDKPIIPLYEPEDEGIYEGLIKPTAKALIKVPTSVALSMTLLPGAGIASLIELTHVVSPDPDRMFVPWDELWGDAVNTYKQVMSIPSAFITTPAERKAIENISSVMKPIEMAGEGWGLIGKAINDGLVQLGLEPTYLEPLLATYGEAAAIFAIPRVIKHLKNSTTFRMLSIKERGLVVQSLTETMKKNPGMTEGQLLRTYNNPQWMAEALSKRSISENYAKLKRYAEVKSREVKIKSVMKVCKEEPPRPQSVIKPEDITPSHTFTSKKGNYYYKSEDKWYDNKGKEITNRFVIRAAEKKKILHGVEEIVIEKKVEPSKPKPGTVIDFKEKTAERLHEMLMDRTISSIDRLLLLQEAEIANLRTDIDIKFVSKDRDKGTMTYEVLSGKHKGKTFETTGVIILKDIPVKDLTYGDIDVRPIIRDYDTAFKKPEYLKLEEIIDIKPKPPSKVEVVEIQTDIYHRNISVPAVRESLEAGNISEARAIYNQTRLSKSELWGDKIKSEIEELETKGLGPSEISIEQSKADLRDAVKREREKPGAITERDIRILAGRIGDDRILEALDLKTPEERLKQLDELAREPITEVDRQTGVSVPKLKAEKSSFFQTKEEAFAESKVYEGRKIVDVEVAAKEIINRINRAYHGDKSVDITKAKNDLNELASRVDEFDMAFDNPVDYRIWVESVKEAVIWARRIEPLRSIKKQREEIPVVKEGMEDLYSWYVTARQRRGRLTRKEIETSDVFKSGKRSMGEIIEYLRTKNVEVVKEGVEHIDVPRKTAEDAKVREGEYFLDSKSLRLIKKRRGETTELGIDDPLTFKDESGTTRSVVAKDYGEVEKITGIRLNYDMVGEISKNSKLKKVRYFSGIPQSPMLEQALMFIKNKMPKVWNIIDNVSVIPGSVFKDGAGSYRHDIKTMQLTYDPKHTTIRGYVNTIAHELGHAFEQRRIPKKYEGIFAEDLGNKAMRIFDKEFGKQKEGVELYTGIDPTLISKLISRIKRKVPEKPPDPYPSVKEEAMEIVRRRRGRLNLANYETNKFLSKIRQKTTPKQREAFIFALEKTNVPKEFNRPDLQKVLDKDRKHIEIVSKEIKEWFDEGWKKIKYHIPDLSVKQIEDYVTHLWDIPKHKKAEAAAWFSTQNRLLERRFIPTYAEGIKRGYKPKTLDILEIIRVHDSICNRAIENVRFIKNIMAMRRNGAPLIQWGDDAPLDWIEINYPAITRRIPISAKEKGKEGEFVKGIRTKVHPELARPLKVIFEERFNHPIISAYEAINGIMKKTMLSLQLFHHGALGEVGIAFGIPLKTLNIYFNPVKIYKALVRGELDIFTNVAMARRAINAGTQFGATADIPVAKIQRYLDDLAKVSKGLPIVNKLTQFLSVSNSIWDKALWVYIHDTLKLYGFESLVGKLDLNLDARQIEMAEREIANFVNKTFGGLNWESLMVSPKEVQMITWALLSADWTVSTTLQALSPTGIGSIYKETRGLNRKMGLMFWLRAALFFGVGMNMLNAMFRDRDMKENPQYYEDREYSYFEKTMFGNTIGKKTYLFKGRYNDGTERYVRWGKQFRDFFELLITPFRKLGGKMAPVPQLMSEIFSGHTLSGFKNDDIYGTKGLEKTKGIFKTIAKAPLPISVKRFMKENMEFKPLDIVMQSSKGMSRYTAMEYFKKAIIEGDEDLLTDTYIGTLRNNLPAFTLFNSALSWVETEIVIDIAKDIEGIEDARNKLSAAKSAYDIKRYGRVLRRLEKERADKEAGLKLLGPVIEKARSYRDLGLELDRKVPKFPTKGIQSKELGEIRFE